MPCFIHYTTNTLHISNFHIQLDTRTVSHEIQFSLSVFFAALDIHHARWNKYAKVNISFTWQSKSHISHAENQTKIFEVNVWTWCRAFEKKFIGSILNLFSFVKRMKSLGRVCLATRVLLSISPLENKAYNES